MVWPLWIASWNEENGMTIDIPVDTDWMAWLRRWDRQQTGYLPNREDRFNAMLDVLAAQLPEDFVAVDLACGPGSISERLLARFPKARSIAVDLDPVLLAIGQGALGTFDGRLRWVDADLSQEDWVQKIGESQVDAVLSTTALHWLTAEALIQVYRQLGELIRPGGVFLNGDHMKFPPHMEGFQKVAEAVRERRRAGAFEPGGAETWEAWWNAIKAESSLAELVAERDRRFGALHARGSTPRYELHVAALRDAGFREAGVIWQNMDNRVLMAIR
jgi:SAM-dependent methyltransferase